MKEASAQQEVRSRLRGPNRPKTKAGPTDLHALAYRHIILEEDSQSGESVLTRSQPGPKEAGRTGGRISWLALLKTHNKPLREVDT